MVDQNWIKKLSFLSFHPFSLCSSSYMFNKTTMFTFNNIITNFLKVRIDANIFSLLCFTLPLCELPGNFLKLISYFCKSMVKRSHSVFFTLISFANWTIIPIFFQKSITTLVPFSSAVILKNQFIVRVTSFPLSSLRQQITLI